MRPLLRRLLSILFLALASAGAGFAVLTWAPIGLSADTVEFTIEPGSSLRAALREIAAAGADLDRWVIVVLARLTGVESSIKAGSYAISRGTTPIDLLRKLTRGDFDQAEVALIEGWTFRQWRERLDAHPDLRHDTAGLGDEEIMQRIGAAGIPAEGAFFPDTYLFARGSSDVDLLARAYRAMHAHLAREWAARTAGLPYRSPAEALVIASLVEKETGHADDRPLVAGVLVNRLRSGMPLQSDPTVIYGIGAGFDGNLRRRDLLADTPWNTYTRRGLPPTPIAMVGLASLRAALNPAPGAALYFVARGDGSSHFSRTLAEHNDAVTRYQKGGQR
ncbi:endolytic transglycosylase MltG [Accumulibacter sp.]|uniref:endolytic transglycosylase MltG n=1 Tax=Accumulibacter sp. TaxID=2053492 RepID=UPI0025DDC332|nr:endolytic transglycosylase MltG [Accumulibacter sp.]MCM8594571.1 endolytic transglycosylase MltG [Accumulibacter sp.]MCM8627419.1 endolytic transglycosylase MltG [Accumulibacter sp.]MDS4048717.1 endolytic transglycosylase MltG [Accumulibacter sp.]